ncbi:glycosyltransferase family 20 [Pochonia chlamydosporia 170]|uniref:Glycosyltransferase family 20 n=1 Tax=Pochonia chlamydosporia 170 TaxID=1380566 RepID=A0A179EXU7_METCM|nr:glycosyltransferase family 20 [Pochonia chlamydosporia 170]OAQ58004.2 glycosyltransferase family 20 [Pochonia chlamydosporia 170]
MTYPRQKGPSRNITHLPAPAHQSDQQVPVTPGIGRESYNQDYFERRVLNSPSVTPGYDSTIATSPFVSRTETQVDQQQPSNEKIISVTFTVPHLLEYREGSNWVSPRRPQCMPVQVGADAANAKDLRRCYHRSALLDALHYLSANGSYNHVVVAWTGEIRRAPSSDNENVPINHAFITPSSTSISLGGRETLQTTQPKNIFVTRADQQRLECQLHQDEICFLPVWLAEETDIEPEGIKLCDQSRWRQYAEHDLCALLHYRQHPPSEPYSEGVRWANYYRMNQRFAEKVLESYRPGDVVIVHDYYLMLLPLLLRKRHPHISITFYLHTPFPSSELIRCLCRRQSVLEGMLGSDLIAFQSFHYAQHFANSCARILGLDASSKVVQTATGRVRIRVIPMGIDISAIHSLAWKTTVTEMCSALRKQHSGKKIIVAYDPKDRLGGVDKKLLAFGRFLDKYPEYQNRVILVQVMSQTSIETDDREESKYAAGVSELVSEINSKYGSLDFMPIQLHSQSLTTSEYFALLRSGDLALFTSVRDGMSTTSLEYVVCQQHANGPIIISEFSGTAGSLKEAIKINPWDTTGVADKIHEALNMSEKSRQTMQEALYKRTTERDVQYWVTTVIHSLKRAVNARESSIFVALGMLAVIAVLYRIDVAVLTVFALVDIVAVAIELIVFNSVACVVLADIPVVGAAYSGRTPERVNLGHVVW